MLSIRGREKASRRHASKYGRQCLGRVKSASRWLGDGDYKKVISSLVKAMLWKSLGLI